MWLTDEEGDLKINHAVTIIESSVNAKITGRSLGRMDCVQHFNAC
jgi:hypothetical protein